MIIQQSIGIDDAKTLTTAELAGLSAKQLMRLQEDAHAHYQHAQSLKEWIDDAIALKYHERAQGCRRQIAKDTGTAHFDDDGIHITARLPKRIVWHQAKMAAIANDMHANGEDPSDLMKITYGIYERDYQRWPHGVKAMFKAARTVKTGKPVFTLSIPTHPSQSSHKETK